MAWRFGDPGRGAAAGPPAPERPRARYLIPCNLRTRLRPDGTCPCAGVHDAAWFRRTAGLRAWVVAGNDQRDYEDDGAWEAEGDDEDEDEDEDWDGDDPDNDDLEGFAPERDPAGEER